jgi:hypothetical protein
MTADTPAVLYVSIDRSGLSPVPVASFHKHMGAEEWVPMETLDALREALTEAVEVVHKAYVAATMEAVNAGPSHPLMKNYDAWRVRCMKAETKGRAALAYAQGVKHD